MQWIPSHCCIAGNDVADFLAKKGIHIIQTSPSIISYNRAAANTRFRVREAFRNNLELQMKDKPWKVFLEAPLPDWPRRVAGASFRTATGHDCLGRHLHHIAILPTQQCIFCNSTDDMDANLSITIKQQFRGQILGGQGEDDEPIVNLSLSCYCLFLFCNSFPCHCKANDECQLLLH